MILDRYFARRFLGSFLLISAVFMTLIVLIDVIEQLRDFDGIGFARVLGMTLLNVPGALKEILPLLMILSTILLYVSLARSSELVIARASGRSGIRALAAPATVAFVIGVLAVTTLGPIAAATANRYADLADFYRTGGATTLSFTGEGLWLRQGDANGQSVIHASGYGESDDLAIYDVTIISYAPGGGPVQRISAVSGRLEPDAWVLRDAKVWPLDTGGNPETVARTAPTLRFPTSLTPERIRESLGRDSGVSIYALPETIRTLREAGFSTRRQEVWLQVELARPLFLMAMVLVGAAFTMRHTRFGGTGASVLTAVLLGFALYFIRNFAQILGENGQIPVTLAAWGPPVASLMLTFGLLLHVEDG